MNTAKFSNKNGVNVLLCSKCLTVIKTEEQFSTMEKYAFNGDVTLLPQYCDEHAYINMVGREKKKEMIRRGIKEKLRENILGDE